MSPSKPVRIASLVPSLTELLVALGLGPNLVARTGFCIHPAAALRDVPKVGGTKDVNLAKLARLAPTHVLVNIDENRRDTADALRDMGVALMVTHPLCPADLDGVLTQCEQAFGHLPGVRERAAALRTELQLALADVRPEVFAPQRVLYLIWREPWMTVARDTYISRLLAQANWHTWPPVDGGASGASRYPVVNGDEPWLAEVQQVLLSSEPYNFRHEHLALAQQLCPGARVQLVDGELLSWYGPRAPDGLRYAASLSAAR